MNMKKILRMLFVMMLALSLIAFVSCGDEDEPEKDPYDDYNEFLPGFGEGVEGPIIPYE